jgi:hypothetical protein
MLKVLLHEPLTLRWWYEQFRAGRVEMSPKYQRRGEIWSKFKRAHLLDSILNDFDVPKFYVANFSLARSRSMNPSQVKYAIIDGKQRFGAIFAYFSDEIELNSSFVLDDDPALKLGKCRYSDLALRHPSLASKIDNFVPTVMNVITDDETKIEELFVRLNAGEAANGAERRNALGGPVPVITRELAGHAFFTRKISFSTKRMQEHNLIQKLLLLEFKGQLVDTKAKNLDDFANDAKKWDQDRPDPEREQDLGPYGEARDRVYETLEALAMEFEDKDKLLAKQGEIPIYYWVARHRPTWVNELRDFVLQFSDQLLENLREQRDDPNAGDPELSVYYTSGRTTNDQQSLALRYKLFEKRFSAFRRPGGRRR